TSAMSITAALRRSAQVNPRGAAIRFGQVQHDWQTLVTRVAAIAGGLRARGLQPGEHVACLGLNSAELLEAMLAVWWAGSVLVPLNTRLAWEEYRYILDHSQARLLISDRSFEDIAQKARAAVRGLKECVGLDETSCAGLLASAPIEATL